MTGEAGEGTLRPEAHGAASVPAALAHAAWPGFRGLRHIRLIATGDTEENNNRLD